MSTTPKTGCPAATHPGGPEDPAQDANREHFERKAAWKQTPGARFTPKEPTPMDDVELQHNPEAGGLVLDWI